LQEVFLSSVRDAGVQVTMFLVNGVMLQGKVAAYDLFCMLLEREGYVHWPTSMPSRRSSLRAMSI
jgi:host factor-I protein